MSFVAKAVKSVVKAVTKVVKTVVKAVVDVASSIVNFVTQPFAGLFGTPDIPSADQAAAQEQGVLVQKQGSNLNIPIIYGYRKTGGIVTYAETGASDNKYLWVAYVLGEGPIEGLKEIFIDDYQLPEEYIPLLNNGQNVAITKGKYKNRCRMQLSHGKYFDTPSDSTVGTWSLMSDAPSWKDSMVYNGLAVLFCRWEWKKIETQEDSEENPFGGSIPEVQASVLGRKIASLTIASPDSYTYANAPTRYSTNPAEILLDYLRNPRYGKGLVNTDIDWDSWKIAAAKCNTEVEFITGTRAKILQINPVVNTQQTLFQNVKFLLAQFRGYMPYVQGKYKLRIEDAGNDNDITSGAATIVQTFTKDDIIGNVTFTGIDKSAKYNAVSVQYVNPDNKWSMDSVVYPETDADRATYIAQDNGRENKYDVTFGAITNYAIAKDMAKLIFNKSRNQESVSLTVTSKAMELEVGDSIRIQSQMLDFDTDPFRVVSIRYNNDMSVTLGCVRNPDTIYPHAKHGEEDIVLPPYIPKGATIFYPAVQDTPVGLVPPTNAEVPVVHYPPTITSLTPDSYVGAGVNTITLTGTNFQSGISVKFIGDDATEYTATSVTVNSTTELEVDTLVGMTSGNSPYDILITNTADYGSLSARINFALAVKAVISDPDPDPDPPIQDPPVVEDPEDPDVTPPPSDPPAEGPPPTNPPTVPPEEIVEINDVLDIEEFDYYDHTNNTVYVNVKGLQPQNAAYSYLKVWWKRNISTDNWQYFEVKDKPGPGREIEFSIGPMIRTSTKYIFITRVVYGDGTQSTRRTKQLLDPAGAADVADVKDYTEAVGEGWSLPEEATPSKRNNTFNKIQGQTVLDGSNEPLTPRTIDFTFKQEIDQEAVNWDVVGVKMYYRPSTQDYWNSETRLFTQPYTPGIDQTLRFALFGSAVFPSIPSAAQNQYDFIFRVYYKDGKESTRQVRYGNAAVEYSSTGLYDYDPLADRAATNENSGDFEIVPPDPDAPSATEKLTVGIKALRAQFNTARFELLPPDASVINDWAGIKFRYRKVIAGANPALEEFVDTSVSVNATTGTSFRTVALDYEDEYEVIITALYWSGVQRLESEYSWFGSGYLSNRTEGSDVPLSLNWKENYNFKLLPTADAVADATAPFPAPANPRVNIVEWSYTNPPNYTYGTAPNGQIKLTFRHDHIGGYSKLWVYRRDFATAFMNRSTWDLNKYGAGRWEKVEVTDTNASGVTIYLRQPLRYSEYDAYYDPAVVGDELFVSWAKNKVGQKLADRDYEFVLVVETTSGLSSVGLKMPFPTEGTQKGQTYDLLSFGVRPEEIDYTDYNNYDTTLEKNFNQAIVALDGDTALWSGSQTYNEARLAPGLPTITGN